MSNSSSYFDQTWINPPSSLMNFFSDECKDNLNCGCGDEPNDSRSGDKSNQYFRGRQSLEEASLAANSFLSRRISRSLSPNYYDSISNPLGDAAAINAVNDYEPYYSPQDFTSQTWLTAISETISIQALAGGATVVLGAVVIIHPLALVGAATAAATAAVGASVMYAVGLLCDIDKGYSIWSADDFGSLFWKDAPNYLGRQLLEMGSVNAEGESEAGGENLPMVAIATVGSREIIEKDQEHLRRVFLLEQRTRSERLQSVAMNEATESDGQQQDVDSTIQDGASKQQFEAVEKNKKRDKWTKRPDFMKRRSRKSTTPVTHPTAPPQIAEPPPISELRRTHSAPAVPSPVKVSLDELLDKSTVKTPQPTTPTPKKHISTQQLLAQHFPPLQKLVVENISFPNLHTAEFFRVFFADDAPYSMKDFQSKRGDVDVVYGKWGVPKDIGGVCVSFKDGVDGLAPIVSSCVRERTMTFNTLTKSYFGPAYAKANKTQRAIQLSENLLVIENKTQLADIPFADRFLVIERWIIEAVKNEKLNHSNSNGVAAEDMAMYTSKLTVHAEVIMLKSCSWEAQIQKKASETFTDLVTDWVKTATKALKATEEKKRMRLGLSHSDSKSSKSTHGSRRKETRTVSPTSSTGSELIAKHRRNFQELDKLIANGDLEWESIEVMHSFKAGKHSAFAQVLERPPVDALAEGVSKSSTEETDITDSTDGLRAVQVATKRRSRNFLGLLSARKGSRLGRSVAKNR